MKLTKEEKAKLLEEIKAVFLKEVRERAVKAIFDRYEDRISKHIGVTLSSMDDEIMSRFPL